LVSKSRATKKGRRDVKPEKKKRKGKETKPEK